MGMKTLLLWAPLSALYPLVTALPFAEEPVGTILGKRGFFEDHLLGPNPATDHFCTFHVEEIYNGWSGDFGPWDGSCDQMLRLQPNIQHSRVEDGTNLHIDLIDGLVNLKSDYYGTFSCNATIGHGQGCNVWQRMPLPKHELAKRTALPPPTCGSGKGTDKAKNPNPSTYESHKQIGAKQECNQDATCSAGVTHSTTFTWGFTLTSGPSVTDWITAGFDVTKSATAGTTHTCGGKKGETVCVFGLQKFQCYNVQNYVCSGCEIKKCKNSGSVSRLCSPVKQSKAYGCGLNAQCHNPGYTFKS